MLYREVLTTRPNWWTAIIIGIFLILLVLAFGIYRLAFSQKIYRDVYIGSLDVGGLSRSVARDKILARVAILQEQGIPVVTDGKLEHFQVSQAVLAVDVEAAVAEAWNYRSEEHTSELQSQFH